MACALALLAGCTTTPWGLTSSARLNSATSDAKTAAPSPPKSSGSQADAQSLEQVMRELQQFMALDAAAQDKLMGDLEQVDPTLQPMFLQSFLAEAAYRHREAEREAAEQNQATTAPISLREEPGIRTTLAGEGRESTAALAPPPTSLPIVNLDNGPALSPEPPVMGGIDNSSTTALTAADRLGEAGATPAEPRTLDAGGTPTLRTRLAALRARSPTAPSHQRALRRRPRAPRRFPNPIGRPTSPRPSARSNSPIRTIAQPRPGGSWARPWPNWTRPHRWPFGT